jgi:hypothetical protein
MPLGNNGEYIEMSLNAELEAMEKVEELKPNNEQPELPESSPKDAASDGQDSAPVVPQESVTKQAQTIAELVPIIMQIKNISEGTAVNYLESLKKRVDSNSPISSFLKQDIERIAKANGLSLNAEQALEWFKKLC